MKRIRKALQYHFEHPNYLFFMLSLIVLILVPSLVSFVRIGGLLLEVAFGIVILIACIYTSNSYRDLLLLGILGAATYLAFHFYMVSQTVVLLIPFLSLVFFGWVFVRIMQYVLRPKTISINDVFALCSGYLVLGVIATPFFVMLNLHLDNALSIPPSADLNDLLYFSFITLTGVGYGDIVPIHNAAKSVSLLLGIIGQLYLAILAGIIIGKFLAREKGLHPMEEFLND